MLPKTNLVLFWLRHLALITITTLASAQFAEAQFTQQGSELVGSDVLAPCIVGTPAPCPNQGGATALSADGNTLIMGGPYDAGGIGAAWVFVRSGSAWTQQAKLVGTGYTAAPYVFQGMSVGLSGDGNTAIVGGPFDNKRLGAAWIFVRNNGTWSQQSLLVGDHYIGAEVHQGRAVALSYDGNTAMIGADADNKFIGAVWVFTRKGTTWSDQGRKLVPNDRQGAPSFGWSLALSNDGNTAIIGGLDDNNDSGAAWIFTRTDDWDEQGYKLVGNGAVNASSQGGSVALSADGNTAVIGGHTDNKAVGAAWIFRRSGGAWTQDGLKLVGTGYVPVSTFGVQQGESVAISGDASTVALGGPLDNNYTGAAWVFTYANGKWSQLGAKLVGSGAVGRTIGHSVALSSDGKTLVEGNPADWLWEAPRGRTAASQSGAWVFVRP
ncbi:hypothetical protein ACVW1C_000154 [Bradyrhizobium sp. USDA 4011]